MSRAQRLIAKGLGIALSMLLVDAQEFRGVISGQISDPSGASVPAAIITALREGTQQPYTAQSNSSGVYSIPYVLPGSYTVTVEAAGFKKAIRQRVNLDVSQKLSLNISLEV